MRSIPRQQGFTLIEMLVAVGLLSLLGVASALALDSALRSQAIMTTKQQALEQLQRTQRLLSRDLEQLLLRQGRDPVGDPLTPALIAYPQADPNQNGLLLQFFKTGRRLLNQTTPSSRLEQVRYRIEEQQLWRDTTPMLDPSGSTPWRSTPLLEAITALELRFYHRDQWHSQWPPLNQTRNAAVTVPQLPVAIEIRMQTQNYAEFRQLILIPGGS